MSPSHSPHRRPPRLTRRAPPTALWRRFPIRSATFCLVELQKLRHDRTELFTRAVQPVLWLLIFGETFNRLHAIPTGDVPVPRLPRARDHRPVGLFVAIFYGIQIIWERDAGVLTKLLVTPTPRSALILGKAFAAGIRAMAQVVVVLVVSALSVCAEHEPAAASSARSRSCCSAAAFFACLSMTIAGIVLQARPADGHRPDDHDAAVLRLERALPGRDHAGLAAGAQPGQPADATRSTRCAGS